MESLFQNVKENVYVLAVWDSEWNSYNNCYIILEQEGVILIDTGKKEHSGFLIDALQKLGKTPDEVTLVLATHGHEDHVQGAALFKNAKKYIHQHERNVIEYPEPDEFIYELVEKGELQEFKYVHVGYHTPGSVVFYHCPSKILFMGDFLCFFGDPLSEDGLVSVGTELRTAWLEYLQNGGVRSEVLNSFLNGLKKSNDFDTDTLCTGHGGVLTEKINTFFSDLVEIGEQLQNTK